MKVRVYPADSKGKSDISDLNIPVEFPPEISGVRAVSQSVRTSLVQRIPQLLELRFQRF